MTFVHRSRCHDKSRVSIVSNPFKDVRLVDDGLTRPTSRANFSWTRRSRVSTISKVLVVVHPRLDGFCRVRKRSSQEGKLCSFKYPMISIDSEIRIYRGSYHRSFCSILELFEEKFTNGEIFRRQRKIVQNYKKEILIFHL